MGIIIFNSHAKAGGILGNCASIRNVAAIVVSRAIKNISLCKTAWIIQAICPVFCYYLLVRYFFIENSLRKNRMKIGVTHFGTSETGKNKPLRSLEQRNQASYVL